MTNLIRAKLTHNDERRRPEQIVELKAVPNKGDYFNIDQSPISDEVDCVTYYHGHPDFDVSIHLKY